MVLVFAQSSSFFNSLILSVKTVLRLIALSLFVRSFFMTTLTETTSRFFAGSTLSRFTSPRLPGLMLGALAGFAATAGAAAFSVATVAKVLSTAACWLAESNGDVDARLRMFSRIDNDFASFGRLLYNSLSWA